MTTTQKIIVSGLLLGTWGGLVSLGMAPADQFVSALRDALIALGVFQATTSKGQP